MIWKKTLLDICRLISISYFFFVTHLSIFLNTLKVFFFLFFFPWVHYYKSFPERGSEGLWISLPQTLWVTLWMPFISPNRWNTFTVKTLSRIHTHTHTHLPISVCSMHNELLSVGGHEGLAATTLLSAGKYHYFCPTDFGTAENDRPWVC